ncbi:MAG: hypothetical protein MJ060_01935, partial [Clostridia bacterium]|nr:hypothetical protein [Clostridia bacterium]
MATITKSLFGYLTDIFSDKDNENGLIIIDTIMKACGFDDDEKETVNKKGLKEVSDIIKHKIIDGNLTSKKFLDQLFDLSQDGLDQLPIEYFALIVKSDTFNKEFSKNKKNEILKKIAGTVGINVDDVNSLKDVSPESVAYNSEHYRAIFQAYHEINDKRARYSGPNPKCIGKTRADIKNQLVDHNIKNKMQEMVDKAPGLKSNPNKVGDLMNLSAKHKGKLDKAADEVLNSFADTVYLSEAEALKGVTAFSATNGLNKKYEQYSFKTAKAVLAQYKLGAFARAAAELGTIQCFEKGNRATSTSAGTRLVTQSDIEKFSVVDPAKNDKPVNRLINASRNVVANFTKPQNLARLGFRTTITRAVTQGISHFSEAAFPWVGAAVGLAMTVGDTLIKIGKEKEKPVAARKTTADIWKEAAPDLARGAVVLGASAVGASFIAAPIATVASNFVKSLQVAHKEGLTAKHGFWKRVGKEM